MWRVPSRGYALPPSLLTNCPRLHLYIPIDAARGLFEGGCDITLLDSQPFDLRGVAAIEHAFRLGYL